MWEYVKWTNPSKRVKRSHRRCGVWNIIEHGTHTVNGGSTRSQCAHALTQFLAVRLPSLPSPTKLLACSYTVVQYLHYIPLHFFTSPAPAPAPPSWHDHPSRGRQPAPALGPASRCKPGQHTVACLRLNLGKACLDFFPRPASQPVSRNTVRKSQAESKSIGTSNC